MQYLSKDVSLYLSQNAVHHPIDARGADAVGSADATLLQMLHYALNEWKLNVFGVLDMKLLTPLLITHDDGLVGEDGEMQLPSVANQLDAVGAGALVTDKAPRSAAGQAVGKLESCAHGVFRLIKSAAITTETLCFDDRPEYFLQQVNLVRS